MTTSSTTPRVALVTGANKGVGRAIAQQFAELGMTVYLGARNEERGAQAESESKTRGSALSGVPPARHLCPGDGVTDQEPAMVRQPMAEM